MFIVCTGAVSLLAGSEEIQSEYDVLSTFTLYNSSDGYHEEISAFDQHSLNGKKASILNLSTF